MVKVPPSCFRKEIVCENYFLHGTRRVPTSVVTGRDPVSTFLSRERRWRDDKRDLDCLKVDVNENEKFER